MRVIKFRGKKNSIWYKGNLIQRTLHTGTVYFIASFETPEIENAVEESTVGQFTGLKDKNNVEIYEGDILDIGNDYKVYVNWDLLNARFSLYQHTGHKSNVTLDMTTSITYEVVGNIYDNLEVINNDTTKHSDL